MSEPTTETPAPAPATQRIERSYGVHTAVIERVIDRWSVLCTSAFRSEPTNSQLDTRAEALYYDDEDAAIEAADTVLNALHESEQAFRAGWHAAYQTASGRYSAPDVPGPAYTVP